jgi:16S rRNA (guanine527-N7)-methyltransferase
VHSQKPNKPFYFESQAIISKYGLEKNIETYLGQILDYNKKINLVSRETSSENLLKIAADSLIPFEFIPQPTGKIFDIGPGAGFPSIVIMLAFPDLKGLLIERTKKKTIFLQKIIERYALNAEVKDINFIEVEHDIDFSSFDFGFMKLVRIGKNILTHALRLLKPGGRFIYYSDIDNISFDVPDKIKVQRLDYHLDKSDRRTITVFSSAS